MEASDDIVIQLWGGPYDGAEVEIKRPTQSIRIFHKGHSVYWWDGESPLNYLVYKGEEEPDVEAWEHE